MPREGPEAVATGNPASPFAAQVISADAAPTLKGSHVTLSHNERRLLGLMVLTLAVIGMVSPQHLFQGLYGVFILAFCASAAVRLAAVLTPRHSDRSPPLADEALPPYTLIVPLYREAEVARELVANLDKLDYPRDRLQALIVLEADDLTTQAAFGAMDLPCFIEVLVVPPDEPRTKPRACNAALPSATGDLVVIYDAEDAPDPQQLRQAAARFADEDSSLACLQAPLRVEVPPHLPFIAEQFRLEYAAHFEVLLPAYAQWRMPFPLGGTSNHFKAAPLKAIGGWDAYNVTEDADIGFRLAAAGHRLATIDRPTLETAPTSIQQWRPQRARWIKGHMQTLACHGRCASLSRPRAALALIITLAVPVAASNLHAPAMVIAAMSMTIDWTEDGLWSIPILHLVLYAACWSVSAISGVMGVTRAGGAPRFLHLFGMVGYWMMWALASPRAIKQFFFEPHRWDKTLHKPRAGRHAP